MDIFSIGYDALYIIVGVISAIVRASGVTIESGYTGLLYTLGEVDRPLPIVFRPFAALLRLLGVLKGERGPILEPGFHPLIPFLQRVRKVPTRQRTMDLPAQRVATFEGYVFHADANIVFRIVDVRKALIVVDHLVRGMKQMLTLGVQEVLREASLRDLQSGVGLDEKLMENLAKKVEVWGVTIEGAGFPTITPSPRTPLDGERPGRGRDSSGFPDENSCQAPLCGAPRPASATARQAGAKGLDRRCDRPCSQGNEERLLGACRA